MTSTVSRETQTDASAVVLSRGLEPARSARRPPYDPASAEAERAGLVRLKATCEYDGTCFCGWMVQGGTEPSVQGVLEARLSSFLRRPVAIAGSGRTDAGVSARAQVFHVDVEPAHSPASVLRALQSGLPPSLRVTAVEAAPAEFHARHSCIGKRYSYVLLARQPSPFEARWCWSLAERQPAGSPPLELNVASMGQAGQLLVGVHDFSHFCVRQPNDPRSPVRHIQRCSVVDEGDARFRVTIEADRFLYKQMRMMVGTLVQVGLGRLSVPDFAALILQPHDANGDAATPHCAAQHLRNRAVYTAPANGLLLEHVFYTPGQLGTSSVTPATRAALSAAYEQEASH